MAYSYREPGFLRAHIASLMDFYHPRCVDREYGGFINQLRDDGSVFDRDTKHLVGTCRFIYNYAIASLVLHRPEYRAAAAHGVDFLQTYHRQPNGGYAWILCRQTVQDGTRHCYGHAFVLLALAAAHQAGLPGMAAAVAETFALLEERFWRPEAGLYVDEISSDWTTVSPYRGQNANMHLCEALLAAYEATGVEQYLERAYGLARRICVDLTRPTGGLIWEHYHSDWTHDWDYNRHNPKDLFRPHGYLPGHSVEWSKLLLVLERYRKAPWLLQQAEFLFRTAMEWAWDDERGGMHYTFAPDGAILDTDRYYWVLAEAIAAAGMLGARTGQPAYWEWYDRAWAWTDRYLVDHKYGGWYRVLDPAGQRYDDKKSPPSKTDYHPLAACYAVLQALGAA